MQYKKTQIKKIRRMYFKLLKAGLITPEEYIEKIKNLRE